jgi:hypothetical protein
MYGPLVVAACVLLGIAGASYAQIGAEKAILAGLREYFREPSQELLGVGTPAA